jgi:hypothetical protein
MLKSCVQQRTRCSLSRPSFRSSLYQALYLMILHSIMKSVRLLLLRRLSPASRGVRSGTRRTKPGCMITMTPIRLPTSVKNIRVTSLRSLAKYMAQLHSLKFDQIGMLQFQDDESKKPKIGRFYDWRTRGDESKRMYVEHAVCSTSAEYYAAQLRTQCLPKDIPKTEALSNIMESIFQSAPLIRPRSMTTTRRRHSR